MCGQSVLITDMSTGYEHKVDYILQTKIGINVLV